MKQLLFILALITYVPAHASFWESCGRAFVMEDPYQYKQMPDGWLDMEIKRLEILEVWGELDREGKERLDLMRRELKSRSFLKEFLRDKSADHFEF